MCRLEVLEVYYGIDVIKLNEDFIVLVNKGSFVFYGYVIFFNICYLILFDENWEKLL